MRQRVASFVNARLDRVLDLNETFRVALLCVEFMRSVFPVRILISSYNLTIVVPLT
jgi:hypothetical protein